MKHNKRRLSILLCCCLLLTLLPLGSSTLVYAAGNGKAIQMGSDALKDGCNTGGAATVYYGGTNPPAWRVIGYNGTGAATISGALTLLAGNNLGTSQFHDSSIQYSGSTLQGAVNGIANGFQPSEKAALIPRTLDGIAGTEVTDAKLWPLSTGEAHGVHGHILNMSDFWWLRSPARNPNNVAFVYLDGNLDVIGAYVSNSYGVRPACELNLDSVLFTSAAAGGKSSGNVGADALKSVSDYTDNKWKLTLKDSTRKFSARATGYDKTSEVVTIGYTGATIYNSTTAPNEYLSAIVQGSDGTMKYYGRILQPMTAKGSCTLNLSTLTIATDDKLYVFSEQMNGDKKTDYAGELQEIDFRADFTAPILTAGTVQRTGDSAATVSFTSNEDGQYYYAVVEHDATAPTINTSGTGTSCNMTEQTINLTNLTAGAKDIYIVVKDASNNDSNPLKMTIPAPSYILSTTPSALDFGSTYPGDPAPAEKTVTVKNEGNQDVKFTLPTSKNYNISANGGSGNDLTITSGSALTLSIAPKAGLSAGNHDEILTISGSGGATASIQLRFTVTERLYTLSTTPSSLSFGSVNAGYTKPQAQNVTVTNTGNQTVTLNQPAAGAYEIGALSKTSLAPNETATFTVTPKTGLPAGNHDETLAISGTNGAGAGVALKFSVIAPPPTPTPSSSGGSSSVSSPNSISATVPNATTNDPYPAVTGLITPQVRLDSDRTVWVDITGSDIENAIRQAKELASEQKLTKNGIALQIDLSGLSSHFDRLPLTLPKEAYQRMIDAGLKHFTVITPQLSLSLDLDSLQTIVQSAAGSSITLDPKVVDTKKLVEQKKISQDIRTAFGNRPLYDFTIKSGDQPIHRLGSGFAKISLPYVPAASENKDELRLSTIDQNGKLIEIADSKYENGSIVGKTNHFSLYGIAIAQKETATLNTKSAPQFQDTQHHWAKAAIDYVAAQGILNGTSKDYFSPDQTVTRGMVVTALYHLAQENQSTVLYTPMPFSDVAAGSYYEAAIQWAGQNKIACGIGQNKFAPDRPISREQLMTLLYQYSKFQGYDTTQSGMATREYSDYALISPWAQPAMTWAVHSGLLSGMNDGTLAPASTATRAQLASILMHFMQKIVK